MGRLGPHVESQLLEASQDLNPALKKMSYFTDCALLTLNDNVYMTSIGANKDIRIFDLSSQATVQIIFHKALLGLGDKPATVALLNEANLRLVVANRLIAILERREDKIGLCGLASHNASITCVLYNPLLRQVC